MAGLHGSKGQIPHYGVGLYLTIACQPLSRDAFADNCTASVSVAKAFGIHRIALRFAKK